MTSREAIYAGLSARLSSSLTVKSVSRRLKTWDQVEPAAQPAVFIEQGEQMMVAEPGRPAKWLLNATVYIYTFNSQPDGPASDLNGLIDGVQAALSTQPGENGTSTTLGGLVQRINISRIETDGGALGDQGVAIIELEILAA